MIIALDGPAGAGKTSTARAVAKGLGYFYMDTGAMYRAITLAVLNESESYSEVDAARISDAVSVDVRYIQEQMLVLLNGEDVTELLRTPWINKHVSTVSSFKAVREKLVDIQRSVARHMIDEGYGVVVDGRDIGTVVFPEAACKFFMIASPEVRAQRRYDELLGQGKPADYDEILQNVNDRDAIDSGRDVAPLRQADDALVLDTSTMSFKEQVSQVINTVLERQEQHDV
ncbi:MAG: (d)CMP kinase [Rhodothermaceae bacterium]|nr:(d)CMP kinase [Rhodothermaceae bacterium]